MARFPRVQTDSREVNQIQFNIAKLLEPVTGLLQKAGQLLGTATNDNASAGYVGEALRSQVTNITMSNGNPITITSLVLTPGDWDLAMVATVNGSAGLTSWQAGISTATNALNGADGDSYFVIQANGTGFPPSSGIAGYRASVAKNTTYYLVGKSVGASPLAFGRLSARRVR